MYAYVTQMVKVVTDAAQMPAADLMDNDVKVKAAYDRLLAQASQQVVPDMEQILSQTVPVLQAAAQQLQAMMPPPPVDPAAAAVQAAAAETQRKTVDDQAKNTLAGQDQMTQAQLDQQKNAILAQRNQIQQDGQERTAAAKVLTTRIDAETATEIASEKLAAGRGTQLTNGESLSEH
jgi:hypothetical protein